MRKKNSLIVMTLLIAGNAFGTVKIIIPPPSWQEPTDSSAQIMHYLDGDNMANANNDESEPDATTKAVSIYRGLVQAEIDQMYTEAELARFSGNVCKISFTTGNTALTDTTPAEVVAFDVLADNTAPGCVSLTHKLQHAVNKGTSLRYPQVAKAHGLLAIDFIMLFDKK